MSGSQILVRVTDPQICATVDARVSRARAERAGVYPQVIVFIGQ